MGLAGGLAPPSQRGGWTENLALVKALKYITQLLCRTPPARVSLLIIGFVSRSITLVPGQPLPPIQAGLSRPVQPFGEVQNAQSFQQTRGRRSLRPVEGIRVCVRICGLWHTLDPMNPRAGLRCRHHLALLFALLASRTESGAEPATREARWTSAELTSYPVQKERAII